MAEYFGLDAIGRRMSMHRDTVVRWHRNRGFLMYRRHIKLPVQGVKRVWYTNDALIQAWEIAEARRVQKQEQDAAPGSRGQMQR